MSQETFVCTLESLILKIAWSIDLDKKSQFITFFFQYYVTVFKIEKTP